MMVFLTIFGRLTTTPEGSPKLFRRSQNVVEHFPKIRKIAETFEEDELSSISSLVRIGKYATESLVWYEYFSRKKLLSI